jgi:hypothetical protein
MKMFPTLSPFCGIMISVLNPNPDSQGSAPDFGRLELDPDPN